MLSESLGLCKNPVDSAKNPTLITGLQLGQIKAATTEEPHILGDTLCNSLLGSGFCCVFQLLFSSAFRLVLIVWHSRPTRPAWKSILLWSAAPGILVAGDCGGPGSRAAHLDPTVAATVLPPRTSVLEFRTTDDILGIDQRE